MTDIAPANKPELLSNGLTYAQNRLLCEISELHGPWVMPCGSRKSLIARELVRRGLCHGKTWDDNGALWLKVWPKKWRSFDAIRFL